ncbi:hypothetical protein CUMW_082990 [Citrus unshiu]|nr:hypothetical protein CUMW_082990 [Citrus unshiu]
MASSTLSKLAIARRSIWNSKQFLASKPRYIQMSQIQKNKAGRCLNHAQDIGGTQNKQFKMHGVRPRPAQKSKTICSRKAETI